MNDNINEVLKDARINIGYTQEELAEITNIPYSTIVKIENGFIKKPSFFTITALIDALKIKDIRKAQNHNNEGNFNAWLPKYEAMFNVVFSENLRTTYKSLLNYSNDLNKPFQRWYRYKEGYSVDLITGILESENIKANSYILDPFMGSGTTILGSNLKGINGIGFEVNPFVYELALSKIDNYSDNDVKELKAYRNKILKKAINSSKLEKPILSTFDKLFSKEVAENILMLLNDILKIKNQKVQRLLKVAILAVLEHVSNYRKAGNGLKKRNAKSFSPSNSNMLKDEFLRTLDFIIEDIESKDVSTTSNNLLFEESFLNGYSRLKNYKLDGAIYSPPYANCFDYTEIYKIELWLGQYIKKYRDLDFYRNKSIRSHLNHFSLKESATNTEIKSVNKLVNELRKRKLWNLKIPDMLLRYFSEMFDSIRFIGSYLKPKGFIKIVVGNSVYGGLIVPTDLFLAEYAKSLGLEVEKIEVVRQIITSSQQYNDTAMYKNYIRESIIHIRKK